MTEKNIITFTLALTEEQQKKLTKFLDLIYQLENIVSNKYDDHFIQVIRGDLVDMYACELKKKPNMRGGEGTALVEGMLVAQLERSIDKLLSEMEVNKDEVKPVIESALRRVILRLGAKQTP